jgi:hypothetical protein
VIGGGSTQSADFLVEEADPALFYAVLPPAFM